MLRFDPGKKLPYLLECIFEKNDNQIGSACVLATEEITLQGG